jgi:hypothetical protein
MKYLYLNVASNNLKIKVIYAHLSFIFSFIKDIKYLFMKIINYRIKDSATLTATFFPILGYANWI